MHGPYEANPEIANRLHAARRAAGFKSARAAALAHGWAEATYRAHETATGYIGKDMLRAYATAFMVDPAWLERDSGEGPPVDPVRQARFRARIDNEGDTAEQAAKKAGRRLRLARRMAGYGSVAEAAAALELNRSTLSAHEVGQNQIAPDVARLYAAGFACSADWLLTGQRPSGLPPAAEADLDGLLSLHDLREARVRETFAKLRQGSEIPPPAKSAPYPRPRGSKSDPPLVMVPEVAAIELYRSTKANKAPHVGSIRQYAFPPDFLNEILNCSAETAVILPIGPEDGPGARILIDRSFGAPNTTDDYAVVWDDGLVRIVAGADVNAAVSGSGRHPVVVGKVCSVIERWGPDMLAARRRDG